MTTRTLYLSRMGRDAGMAAQRAARWLSLAAAPTFVALAAATSVSAGGADDIMCAMANHASPLGGMVPMYLAMSAFHLGPWLKVISRWSGGHRSAECGTTV